MLRRPGAICQCSNGRLLLMNNIAAPFVQQLPAKWGQGRAATAAPLPTPLTAGGPVTWQPHGPRGPRGTGHPPALGSAGRGSHLRVTLASVTAQLWVRAGCVGTDGDKDMLGTVRPSRRQVCYEELTATRGILRITYLIICNYVTATHLISSRRKGN